MKKSYWLILFLLVGFIASCMGIEDEITPRDIYNDFRKAYDEEDFESMAKMLSTQCKSKLEKNYDGDAAEGLRDIIESFTKGKKVVEIGDELSEEEVKELKEKYDENLFIIEEKAIYKKDFLSLRRALEIPEDEVGAKLEAKMDYREGSGFIFFRFKGESRYKWAVVRDKDSDKWYINIP